MLGETARLAIVLGLKDNTGKATRSIKGNLKSLDASTRHTQKGLKNLRTNLGTGIKIGAGIAAGGIALLTTQVAAGIDALAEHEELSKKTAAAIKSTGGAAKVTTKQVEALAGALEDKTTIDDKVIQGAENTLLAFKNVQNNLGEGILIFDRATEAALDMSVATGKDATVSAKLLGRALNDPIKGIKLLAKQGVTLTEKQKAMWKVAESGNDTLEMQAILLDAVNDSFGGQAAAAADGYRGDMARVKDAVEDVQKALARALLPAIRNVSQKLSTFLKDPKTLERIEGLGKSIADFFSPKNMDAGGGVLKKAFDAIGTIDFKTIGDGLRIAGDASKRAFDIFNSMDPEMKKIIIGALAVNKLTGGLVTGVIKDLAGIALKSLSTIMAGNVTVVGKSVTGGGGVPSGGNSGGGLGRVGTVAVVAGGLIAAERYLPTIGEQLGLLNDIRTGTASGPELLKRNWDIVKTLPEIATPIDALTDIIAPIMGMDANLAKVALHTGGIDPINPALDNVNANIEIWRQEALARDLANSQRTTLGFGSLLDRATSTENTLVQNRTQFTDDVLGSKIAVTNGLGFLQDVLDTGQTFIQGAINNVKTALDNKKLSTTVNVNVSTNVSVRDYEHKAEVRARYGSSTSRAL